MVGGPTSKPRATSFLIPPLQASCPVVDSPKLLESRRVPLAKQAEAPT